MSDTVGATAFVLVATAFVAYAIFAARDLPFGDGAELMLAAATDGVAHPPGYPLWIVLGHLFALVPIGSIPFRVNLTAACYHALTVGCAYGCGVAITRRHLSSLAAAVVLAVTPIFVTWSLQAEVFSLNDLFAGAILLLSLLLVRGSLRIWYVPALALLCGLGISNQQTLVLTLPIAAYAAYAGRASMPRALRPRLIALALMLFVAGFVLPYVHTLLVSQRTLAWSFGSARTLPELLDLILRRDYGTGALVNSALAGGSPFARIGVMLGGFGIVGPLATIGAIALAARRERRFAAIYAYVLLVPLVAFCFVANEDVSQAAVRVLLLRFALMPLVLAAPFCAPAFELVGALAQGARLRRIVALAALAAAAFSFVPTARALAITNDRDARTLVRDAFASLPHGAIVFVKGDTLATTAPYFQIVEHRRPDLALVYVDLLPSARYDAQLRARMNVPDVPDPGFLQIAAANPSRSIWGIGDPDVQTALNEVSGPYVAYTTGLASQILPRGSYVPLRAHYERERAILARPEFGALGPARTRDDAFAINARSYYAAAYFNAGIDAERLGIVGDAQRWFALADAQHVPVPGLAEALARVRSRGHG